VKGPRVSRLSVRCSVCFMPRGVLCRDSRGWSMPVGHRERMAAAKAAAARLRSSRGEKGGA